MAGVKGRSGGARPNSGPKKAPPVLIEVGGAFSKPEEFLKAVMNDGETDVRLRVDAAKALLSAEVRRTENGGKKDARLESAKKVAAKFAAAMPPKLVANAGKALN